ncbi:ABC transporter ATP-binding protein [Nocardioides sp. LMS-CY]|uniref:ABC transporter ATP-binding protein n=1 Tax=Nocardioides sp. (strain LMS-CY) TaxID=2840457 RepID=UPI00207AD00A|nr:ABC transporter ATP-binding protein [Nocardioides sp. LMS-CY]
MRSGNAVEARAVERVFHSRKRDIHALGPVDLDVRDGEFVCVVGPSGCGKSTLLRMIAGLVTPSAGELRVRVKDGRPDAAMVFQDYSIFPWKTVLANIRLGLDLAKVERREADRLARSWAAKTGLSDFLDVYPASLSGGMRQRVAIARALAPNPQILLMDEPFAALDAQLRQVLQDELLEVWQADGRRTVVLVTHSLEEAALLGDRILVMSNRPGRLLADQEVPFERPRRPELRATPEFVAFREQLWHLLRDEVRSA